MSLKFQGGSTRSTGNNFFEDYTTTNLYVERTFGFPAEIVDVVNDSDYDDVQLSWDGSTQICELKAAEYKTINAGGRTSIYVKATTGSENIRINAS